MNFIVDTSEPDISVTCTKFDSSGNKIGEEQIVNDRISTNAAKVRISFTATDKDSPIKSTSYSKVGVTGFVEGNSFEITEQGEFTYSFKAIDSVGYEKTVTKTIIIDRNPPIIHLEPSYWAKSGAVRVELKESDISDTDADFSTLEYKIGDTGNWTKGNVANVTAKGGITVYFRVWDKLGNMGQASCTAGIDDISPSADVTFLPGDITEGEWSNKENVKTHISFSDTGGSGLSEAKVSIDKGLSWIEYNGGIIDITVSNLGENSVLLWAIDKVGNVYERTVKVLLDYNGPSVTAEIKTPDVSFMNWTNSESVLVSGVAVDEFTDIDEVSWSCKATGATNTVSQGKEFTVTAEGKTKLVFSAKDGVGNSSDSEEYEIWIDRTKPVIDDMTLEKSSVNDFLRLSSFHASDTLSGVDRTFWRIAEKTEWAQIPANRTFNIPQTYTDGKYSLEVLVVDNAGNEAVKSVDFYIDRIAPTIKDVLIRKTQDESGELIEEKQFADSNDLYAFIKSDESFTDETGLSSISYYISDKWTNEPDFTNSLISKSNVLPLNIISNGTVYLFARATDKAGNSSEPFVRIIRVDTIGSQKPSLISITHPAATVPEDAVATSNAVFKIIPGKSGPSGTSSYEYELYKGEKLLTQNVTAKTDISFSNLEDNDELEYYYIKVRTISGNGLKSGWETYTFRIDTDPPRKLKVMSSTHGNPAAWYSNPSAEVSWTKPLDFTGVKAYYYKISTSPSDIGKLEDDLTKPGIIETTDTFKFLNLKEILGQDYGIVYFTLWAEDYAGNREINTREIRFDAVNPSVANISGEDVPLMVIPDEQGRSARIKWGIPSDNNQLGYIEIGFKEYTSDTYIWNTLDAEETTYDIEDLKPNTDYVVCLKVVDIAGNEKIHAVAFDLKGQKELELSVPFTSAIEGYNVTGTYYTGATPANAFLEMPQTLSFSGGSSIELKNVKFDSTGFVSGESDISYSIVISGYKLNGKGLEIVRNKGLILKEASYTFEVSPGVLKTITYNNLNISAPQDAKFKHVPEKIDAGFDMYFKDAGIELKNITSTYFEGPNWVVKQGYLDLKLFSGKLASGDTLIPVIQLQVSPQGLIIKGNIPSVFDVETAKANIRVDKAGLTNDGIDVKKGAFILPEGFLPSGNEINVQNFIVAVGGKLKESKSFISDKISFVKENISFSSILVGLSENSLIFKSGEMKYPNEDKYTIEGLSLNKTGLDASVPFNVNDFSIMIGEFIFKAPLAQVKNGVMSFSEIIGNFPKAFGGELTFEGLKLDAFNPKTVISSGITKSVINMDLIFGSLVKVGKLKAEQDKILAIGIELKMPDFAGGKVVTFGEMELSTNGLKGLISEVSDIEIPGYSLKAYGVSINIGEISFEKIVLTLPSGFSKDSIEFNQVKLGPDDYINFGSTNIEIGYKFDNWNFNFSDFTLDKTGLKANGILELNNDSFKGNFNAQGIGINKDGSIRSGIITGASDISVLGYSAELRNIYLSNENLIFDADITGGVFETNVVTARGINIKTDGTIEGTVTVPVDFTFTSKNGFEVKASAVIISEKGIRIKGSVYLPVSMGDTNGLDFSSVELILNRDGTIEASGNLKEASITIAGFNILCKDIYITKDNVIAKKAYVTIMDPGYTLEFDNLTLDTRGAMIGSLLLLNLPEFSRLGWNFNIREIKLSPDGLFGNFDIRLPDSLGGNMLSFKNAWFLPEAPFIKLDGLIDQLNFKLGKISFDLSQVGFGIDAISAKLGSIKFNGPKGPININLPEFKIFKDGKFDLNGLTIPEFMLWDYEVHVTNMDISNDKITLEGWMETGPNFNIKPLANQKLDVNSLVINKDAQIEYFDCSYGKTFDFDLAPGIKAQVNKLGVNSDEMYIKDGKIILDKTFPGFLGGSEFKIHSLTIDHEGNIKTVSASGDVISYNPQDKILIGKTRLASGSIMITKTEDQPLKVELKGKLALSTDLPGILSGIELNIISFVIDANGNIIDVQAEADIASGSVLMADVKVKSGKVKVIKDESKGKWQFAVEGSLSLPGNLPGGLSNATVSINRFIIDHESGITDVDAQMTNPSETSFAGGLKVKNYTISCVQKSGSPMGISVSGTFVLPSEAPGILSKREINISSLKFDTSGKLTDIKANTTISGVSKLIGEISGKDIYVSIDSLDTISLSGKIILPSAAPLALKNAEIDIEKFTLTTDGKIKELLVGYKKQGTVELIPGIFMDNPEIYLEQGNNGNLMISAEGTMRFGSIFPADMQKIELKSRKFQFDTTGKLVSADISLENIDINFFNSIKVTNGSVNISKTSTSSELLFDIDGMIRLSDSLPMGLGGKSIAIKSCVISSTRGIISFTVQSTDGVYFDICGSEVRGKFTEANISNEGFSFAGQILFGQGVIIEGLQGKSIDLKKFEVSWDGKIKSFDAGISSIKLKFGGFNSTIENLYFNADGISIEKIFVELPGNMNTRSITIVNAGIRRDGSFYGSAGLPSIKESIAGFSLIIEQPMLDPVNKKITFKSVKLRLPEIANNAEFAFNGVSITPSGLSISGGRFALPNFSVGNALSFRDILAEFVINDDGSFRVEGQGAVFIQGAGTLSAQVAFRNITNEYPWGLEYAIMTYTLSGKGIPIGGTGLNIYEISGSLAFGPPGADIPKEMHKYFDSGIRIGLGAGIQDSNGLGIVKGKANMWLDIKNPTWALKGDLTVLYGMAKGSAIAVLSPKGFTLDVNIDLKFVEGNAYLNVFPYGNGVDLSGGANATFKIPKGFFFKGLKIKTPFGSITLLPPIPTGSIDLFSGGAEFGLFKNGKHGVKGWVSIWPLGDVGAFVDTGGNLHWFDDLDEYQIYNPFALNAPPASKQRIMANTASSKSTIQENTMAFNVPYPESKLYTGRSLFASSSLSLGDMIHTAEEGKLERLIFTIGYLEGDPEVVLISPSGKEYREGDPYVETAHYEDSMIMVVLNPEPGEWRVDVRNIPEGTYAMKVFGKNAVPSIIVTTPSALDETADGNYVVTGKAENAKAGSKVTVYLSEIPNSFAGIAAGEALVDYDGSFEVNIDTKAFDSGTYYIYAALEIEPDLPRKMAYATGSIKIDNSDLALAPVQNLLVSENGETSILVRFDDINKSRAKGFNMYVRNTVTQEEEVINLGYLTEVEMPGYKANDRLEVAIAPYDSKSVEGEKSEYVGVTIKDKKQVVNSFEATPAINDLEITLGQTISGTIEITNAAPTKTSTAYDYAVGKVLQNDDGLVLTFKEKTVDISSATSKLNYDIYAPDSLAAGKSTIKARMESFGNSDIFKDITFNINIVYPAVKGEKVLPEEWINDNETIVEVFGEGFYEGTTASINGKALQILERENGYLKLLIPKGIEAGETTLDITGPNGDKISLSVEIKKPEYSFISYKTHTVITAGDKGQMFFGLASENGFDDSVELKLGDIPEGWNISLDKEQYKPGELAIVDISAPEDIPLGIYSFKVCSNDGAELAMQIEVSESYPDPYISSLSRLTVLEDSVIDIFGYGFGESGDVMLGDKKIDVLSYAKDRITLKIPINSTSGEIYVRKNDVESNKVMLYISSKSVKLYSQERITLMPGESDDIYIFVKGTDEQTSISAQSSSEYIDVLLDKESIIPNASVVMSIAVRADAPKGIYKVTVKASSKSSEAVKTIEVAVGGLRTVIGSIIPVKPDGKNDYYVSNPLVGLSVDNRSNPEIYYNVNDGEFIKYTEPFELKDGISKIQAYAVDENGDKGILEEKTYKVDTTAPVIDIAMPEGKQYKTSDTIKLNFNVSDDVSGLNSFTATLNGIPVVSGQSLSLAAFKGTNTLVISAEDNAGNVSSKSYIFDVTAITNGKIKVMAKSKGKADSDTIYANIKVINTGKDAINLADVKVRYYYTVDKEIEQNFYCDWSSIGGSNVTACFVKMDDPRATADYYVEIGFKSTAGKLQPGAAVEINSRIALKDWSKFNQLNDYSYVNSENYIDAINVPGYVAGVIQYGAEPSGPIVEKELKVSIETKNQGNDNSASAIKPGIKITNTGNTPIDLSKMTIKYYYTSESGAKEKFSCEYASKTGVKVKGNIIKLTTPTATADTCLEIGFDESSGILAAGDNLELSLRLQKDDGSKYTLTNDYSFNPEIEYTPWDKVAVFYENELLYGNQPF